MFKPNHYFQNVSVLITHYNRSASLERLLQSLTKSGCDFAEIIVSDDTSNAEHQEVLKQITEQYNIKLITTPKNGGLGNNINKGQDRISTSYTLYLQEDFEAVPNFAEHLIDAIAIMEERKDLDIARFYAYFKYPYLKFLSKGFSEMYFNPWLKGYRKFYEYSDHPHLRRNDFFQKFGRYAEGLNPEQTEYKMMVSFLQNKGKGIFYLDFKSLFVQRNTTAEPSTMKRSNLLRSETLIITIVRNLYRHVKFNFDYVFLKSRC